MGVTESTLAPGVPRAGGIGDLGITAQLGASEGGSKADGDPSTRSLALNPPRLLSPLSRRMSIFLIRLLRSVYRVKFSKVHELPE